MTAPGFSLFDTSIGRCGVAWGRHGITGVQLPQADAARTRRRLLRAFPDARETLPPPDVRQTIDAMMALLRGERIDLSRVALDMNRVPAFDRQVYEITRAIPVGATRTYGQIAGQLGQIGLARDVGQALGRNPFPIIVPCHRVLAAGGKAGGFSARGGITTKLRLLSIERARTADAPTLFDTGPALAFAVKPRARGR
jgi:methylated-DNA-[protein]-cysteine S-methyltransferase